MQNSELILDSVYTVEPSKVGMWNDGHWNYKWDGRKGKTCDVHQVKYRLEGNGIYTVKDFSGRILQMDKEQLELLLGHSI